MAASSEIEVFGGHVLSASEARAAISAYARSQAISEWICIRPADDCPGAPLPDAAAHDVLARYYAGVTLDERTSGTRRLLGHGASSTDALADLLWLLIMPHLLSETPPPEHVGVPAPASEHR